MRNAQTIWKINLQRDYDICLWHGIHYSTKGMDQISMADGSLWRMAKKNPYKHTIASYGADMVVEGISNIVYSN